MVSGAASLPPKPLIALSGYPLARFRTQCRGCSWCSDIIKPSADISLAASTVSAACSSSIEDDSAYRDCQTFCDPSFSSSHCGLCKCKACGFCECSSEFDDDANERQCQPWCTADYYHDHCSRCKVRPSGKTLCFPAARFDTHESLARSLPQCKACDFCEIGPPCSPTVADDISFEACQSFCSADYADAHCSLCKCRGCDFCAAAGTPASALALSTCHSGIEDDTSREMCQDFCDPRHRQVRVLQPTLGIRPVSTFSYPAVHMSVGRTIASSASAAIVTFANASPSIRTTAKWKCASPGATRTSFNHIAIGVPVKAATSAASVGNLARAFLSRATPIMRLASRSAWRRPLTSIALTARRVPVYG